MRTGFVSQRRSPAAAASHPARSARCSSAPLASAMRNPPANASPAPSVSSPSIGCTAARTTLFTPRGHRPGAAELDADDVEVPRERERGLFGVEPGQRASLVGVRQQHADCRRRLEESVDAERRDETGRAGIHGKPFRPRALDRGSRGGSEPAAEACTRRRGPPPHRGSQADRPAPAGRSLPDRRRSTYRPRRRRSRSAHLRRSPATRRRRPRQASQSPACRPASAPTRPTTAARAPRRAAASAAFAAEPPARSSMRPCTRPPATGAGSAPSSITSPTAIRSCGTIRAG